MRAFNRHQVITGSDQPAWVNAGQSYSFAELRLAVDRLKVAYGESDYESLVAVLTAEPTIQFISHFIAFLELKIPQAVISSDFLNNSHQTLLDKLGSYFYLDSHGQPNKRLSSSPSLLHTDTALVLFTSGSSGQPKGVQLSWKNIESANSAVVESLDFAEVQQQWLLLNLHYSFGMLGQLLPALRCGVPTVWANHVLGLFQLIENSSESGMVSGVPSQLNTLCEIAKQKHIVLPKVSHVVSAGAHMPLNLRSTISDVFPNATVYLNYGQTEAAPRILCLPSSDKHYATSATGYAVGALEVATDDNDELVVRGDQIMLGYLGEDRSPVVDGWLHTGDIAEISQRGLVTIKGRRDSVVKIGGEKVALVEIETALNAIEGVADAVVIAKDDEQYGKTLTALLVASKGEKDEKGENAADKLNHQNILTSLGAALSVIKIPKSFYWCAELPKNRNGKIDRSKLHGLLNESYRIQ